MSQDISLASTPHSRSVGWVGNAFFALLACHLMVDALASLMPSSLGLVEARLGLTAEQSAWLLGLGALMSGIAQPLCALLSDRLATRSLGALGVAVGAIGISGIGLANGFWSLAAIYALGMIGIGMFHPVGASAMGQLRVDHRNRFISLFFVAGMTGGMLGAMSWPRLLSLDNGFGMLPWVAVSAVAAAFWLQRTFATMEPLRSRQDWRREQRVLRTDWATLGVLYVAAALRFCVNQALVYLFVRWVQRGFAQEHSQWSEVQIADASAPFVGNLNASMLAGMAVGGLCAGMIIKTGKERVPMIVAPILFAPFIATFPYAPLAAGYGLAFLSGAGFAALIPINIAVAQQVLPHRPNLASSLMMGGAWAVSMVGPRCAEWGVTRVGMAHTFLLTAAVLAASGLVCLRLRPPHASS
jgi:FSR family fosmidomycin resistance protein-like MFS transporter